MKLAVTGCTGSVGQRVVLAALKAGHIVVGIDTRQADVEFSNDPNFTFTEVDLRNYDDTLKALGGGVEGVIQPAAVPTPQDYAAHTHNT